MIITRTPFRVTLGGGGTDLPSFYEQHGGMIFAMSITKYMYVMINPPTVDRMIRMHYSQSETVEHVSQLKHDLAREALRFQGITDKMEISSMADLPAGTGVGSSSAYLVGLLTALHQYRRNYVSLERLAEEACHLEINVLGKGIGKQDQYMAAFGGLTRLDIAKDGKVEVSTVNLGEGALAEIVANTHIYYTGATRDASEVLSDQDQALRKKDPSRHSTVSDSLLTIKDIGNEIYDAIRKENFDRWGQLTHEHWQMKKRMSKKISITKVDQIYDHVRDHHGVLGGKIIGAGGGGFLMLYTNQRKGELEQYMSAQGMPRLHYLIEPEGSKVVASLSSSQAHNFHSGF